MRYEAIVSEKFVKAFGRMAEEEAQTNPDGFYMLGVIMSLLPEDLQELMKSTPAIKDYIAYTAMGYSVGNRID